MKQFVCDINNFLNTRGKSQTVCLGFILVLVTLLGACEEVSFLAQKSDDDIDVLEYTDVEYSKDGKEIKLYLDGVGVPMTSENRAMTTNMAQIFYDYLEVIFVKDGVARTSWEIGKPAGINGVAAGAYASTSDACLFVGKKDGRTLLGVGKLTSVDGSAGTTITSSTRTVTFSVSAIQTTTGALTGATASFTQSIGGVNYTVYRFDNTAATSNVSYNFTIESERAAVIKHDGTPLVQKRTPRYADGGKYFEPRNLLDTKSTIAFRGASLNPSAGTAFVNPVLLAITRTTEKGIFSFNLQIPVYMVSAATANRNEGPAAITWYIRTGLSSELYSLDDVTGTSSGGCVLVSIGIIQSEWSDIQWTWFKTW